MSKRREHTSPEIQQALIEIQDEQNEQRFLAQRDRDGENLAFELEQKQQERQEELRKLAEDRVEQIMKHVVFDGDLTFLWIGEDTQIIDAEAFVPYWTEHMTEMLQVEELVFEILKNQLLSYENGLRPPAEKLDPDEYFISSSPTGTSIQWEKDIFYKDQKYYIRKI